jgi:hypothetical protein
MPGVITVDANIDMVAALQAIAAVGDEDVDSTVEMSDDSEARVLTHTRSSRTKKHHRVEESGRTV